MIVLLDTSTSTARLWFMTEAGQIDTEWESGRELAKGLLRWLDMTLHENGYSLQSLEGIGVFQGPGSFTGLRIGIATANTLADSLRIPIVTATGEDWRSTCVRRLRDGEDDKIALPLYDRDANITKPRK